jgi:GTP-binding protein
MFVDQVKITLKAGKGGDGCLSFRRERGVPRGGPDGGRGGNGGSIYLISSHSINSLAYFRFHPINKAKKGAHGEGSNRQGKKGENLVLRVPVGTVVREAGDEEVLFDFVSPDQRFLAAEGGKGGRGTGDW